MKSIEIVGKTWPVALPGFAEREEVMTAMVQATTRLESSPGLVLRVSAAAIGLCTTVAAAAGTTYAKSGYDMLAFGGRVYDWLRRQGADAETIGRVGAQLVSELTQDLFPREPEVKAKEDFTGAPGAGSS